MALLIDVVWWQSSDTPHRVCDDRYEARKQWYMVLADFVRSGSQRSTITSADSYPLGSLAYHADGSRVDRWSESDQFSLQPLFGPGNPSKGLLRKPRVVIQIGVRYSELTRNTLALPSSSGTTNHDINRTSLGGRAHGLQKRSVPYLGFTRTPLAPHGEHVIPLPNGKIRRRYLLEQKGSVRSL